MAAGVGPGGAAAARAPLLRAGGAGRRLRGAALLHTHALWALLLAALRLATARPPRMGSAGTALSPRPDRARCLRRGGLRRLAQSHPAGLFHRALRTEVRRGLRWSARVGWGALPSASPGKRGGRGVVTGERVPYCGSLVSVPTETPDCCSPATGTKILSLVNYC